MAMASRHPGRAHTLAWLGLLVLGTIRVGILTPGLLGQSRRALVELICLLAGALVIAAMRGALRARCHQMRRLPLDAVLGAIVLSGWYVVVCLGVPEDDMSDDAIGAGVALVSPVALAATAAMLLLGYGVGVLRRRHPAPGGCATRDEPRVG